jgi:hypothetical protein
MFICEYVTAAIKQLQDYGTPMFSIVGHESLYYIWYIIFIGHAIHWYTCV